MNLGGFLASASQEGQGACSEGFPHDEALLEFATSANVCCGEHAGSLELTQQTVALCERKGVRVGAHPGFPDRPSMGRRTSSVQEIVGYAGSLIEQSRRIPNSAYIKPHGAFYNLLCDPKQDAAWKAAWDIAVKYLEQGHRLMLLDVQNLGFHIGRDFPDLQHPIIKEGFADRAYRPDGTLMPRSEPGAVLHDPEQIKHQVLALASRVDSICLHGDTPDCLEFAELVYKTLVDQGYEVVCGG